MTLSEEILKQIKDMSAALLPPAEIAILLDTPTDQRDYFCDICKIIAVHLYIPLSSGETSDQAQSPETVIKLAVAGSPAAEPLADKYMKEQSINE